ncbi:hypothetical protein [Leisingera daeponensis]|uniref:hypothetical protein n=1 Tax=Leisingera daeponensis TaxID=405746 RepID=UPI001C96664D|nr:hypothetical protein [Leisingera daeponensis]MBY6059043.1 hypothetical protein [Leisingera daeponensis]
MYGSYYCTDPMNTACRMMDLARRMGLEFESLQFEKRDEACFALQFTLSERGTQQAASFEQRIRMFEDWASEPGHTAVQAAQV